jgi:hypothetical protein
MLFIFLVATGWPLAPVDTLHALGNNWGEYQEYGSPPYLHPGIDVMGITVGKPVYAVDSGVVKAWLTISGEWHWRLAIADYETTDSVEAWLYAHIDANLYHKNVGDPVAEGELIGYLVEWPIIGFDHVHFARIKDAGAIWQYGDWAFIENPLNIITPYDDTAKPVFENAYGGNKFAFCQNNTSMYLSSNNLNGNVDIIAKISDGVGLPLYNPVWERLVPYKIEYEIHGQENLPTTLSVIFAGVLNYESNVGVIYKDDATCNTEGDYEYRDYYFIVTNTDGDSIIEASDAAYSWITTDFPDGDYWIVVTAYDAANNSTRDSMLVTVNNMGIAETKPTIQSPPFSILPNPNNGTFMVSSDYDVRILDVTGRVITTSHGTVTDLSPGIYFVVCEQGHQNFCTKVIVVNQ